MVLIQRSWSGRPSARSRLITSRTRRSADTTADGKRAQGCHALATFQRSRDLAAVGVGRQRPHVLLRVALNEALDDPTGGMALGWGAIQFRRRI